MNTLLIVTFIFLIGNVVGLVLWDNQYLDWYKHLYTYKLIVALTCLTFCKIIWLGLFKKPISDYNLYLTGSVIVIWILLCLWIVATVFVANLTTECVGILNNYYRYSDGNVLKCDGEIITTTFTALLSFVSLVLGVYLIQLYKTPREDEVTVSEPPMQERKRHTELEMEEISL